MAPNEIWRETGAARGEIGDNVQATAEAKLLDSQILSEQFAFACQRDQMLAAQLQHPAE